MSELPQIAISIRQPWAWLILNGGKDIENRNWPTKFRGRVLIHASKGMTKEEYEDALMTAYEAGADTVKIPSFHDLQRGGIVGQMEIVDCVSKSPSRWFFERFGFVIRNARPIPFVPCRGALGFFKPEILK